VDIGSVTNTASAHGTPPGSTTPTPSGPSTVIVPTPPQPGISVVKTADPGTVSKAGQTITYSFTVTNTGNVTLSDIAVDDSDFSGTGSLSAIDCPDGSLYAGQVETCTADYRVTQADIDAGSISNTATAHGTPPGSSTPLPSGPSTSTVTTTRTPAMTVVKTADVKAITKAGQKVTYTFAITNTGNVTISDPKVTDSQYTGHGQLSAISCPAGADTLAPGQTEDCTASYTVVAEDLAAAKLSNTATAGGSTPGGGRLTSDPSTATVAVKLPAAPVVAVNTGGYTLHQQPLWHRALAIGGVTAGLLGLLAALTVWLRRRGDVQE
jgi:uncharacterized repeat protein (TIGR01451 family)